MLKQTGKRQLDTKLDGKETYATETTQTTMIQYDIETLGGQPFQIRMPHGATTAEAKLEIQKKVGHLTRCQVLLVEGCETELRDETNLRAATAATEQRRLHLLLNDGTFSPYKDYFTLLNQCSIAFGCNRYRILQLVEQNGRLHFWSRWGRYFHP